MRTDAPSHSDANALQQAIDRKRQAFMLAYFYPFPAVLLAAVITQWITPVLGGTFLEAFTVAVLLNAFYGGIGPGVLASVLAFVAIDYFFVPPFYSLSLGPHCVHLIVFFAAAVMASSLSARLRGAKREIEDAKDKLEGRIERRTLQLSQANIKLTEEVAHRLEAERAILEISSREQRRLGQDLHDGLCQTLVGTRLLVEELERKNPAPALNKIEAWLTEALGQADAVSRGLYPVELESRGLMAALEEMTNSMSTLYGVECRLRAWEPVEVHDSAVATHLYRIAQEALVNSVKGGRATRISVRIFRHGDGVVVRVTDNGVGLANAVKRSGMGLKIMAYRARLIDADLRFRSRRRGGTVVSCSWRASGHPAQEA